MVEQQPSKLMTRVRFPSPAPAFAREAREGCRAEATWRSGSVAAGSGSVRQPMLRKRRRSSSDALVKEGRSDVRFSRTAVARTCGSDAGRAPLPDVTAAIPETLPVSG